MDLDVDMDVDVDVDADVDVDVDVDVAVSILYPSIPCSKDKRTTPTFVTFLFVKYYHYHMVILSY